MPKNGSKNIVFRSFLYKKAQNRAFLVQKSIKKTVKIKVFGLKRAGMIQWPYLNKPSSWFKS